MKQLLLFFSALVLSAGLASAQCTLGSPYQSGTAPAIGATTTMTTCAYAGEYQTVTSVVAGNDYTLTYTGGASNYVTIYDAAFTAVAWGPSPLAWTAPSSGTFYSQPNLDDGLCGTDFSCHTGTWENTSPPPPCPAEIAPWIEPFTGTADPTCWSQTSTSGGPWTYTGSPDFGTNGSGSGYPIVDHTSGVANNYAWMDYSGADTDVALITPEIDVTALTVPELSFWTISHNNSGSVGTFNSLVVEASDGLGGWTPVGVVTGETGPGWVQNLFVVTPYIYGSNLVQFRFIAQSGGDTFDYDNDMPLDDVEVREAPTCPQTSNLIVSNITGTTADITWTDNAGASEWEVEYGLAGYTPGTGTSVLVGTTSTTVTGLSPLTDYQINVRAVCSPGDSSFWTSTATFTSACAVYPTPFIESFETSTLPICWTEGGVNA